MSTKIVHTYKCPDCGERFRLVHGSPLPDFCPNPKCGAYVGPEDGPFVPKSPMIRTQQTAANDWAYRKLEADSEVRAEMALPAIEKQLIESGVPVADAQRMAMQQANDLKVTNMKDSMREGDVAAIGPQPSEDSKQQVQTLGGDPAGSFAGGMAVAGAGPAPVNESGAKFMRAMQGNVWRGAPSAPSATVAGMSGGFGKAG